MGSWPLDILIPPFQVSGPPGAPTHLISKLSEWPLYMGKWQISRCGQKQQFWSGLFRRKKKEGFLVMTIRLETNIWYSSKILTMVACWGWISSRCTPPIQCPILYFVKDHVQNIFFFFSVFKTSWHIKIKHFVKIRAFSIPQAMVFVFLFLFCFVFCVFVFFVCLFVCLFVFFLWWSVARFLQAWNKV